MILTYETRDSVLTPSLIGLLVYWNGPVDFDRTDASGNTGHNIMCLSALLYLQKAHIPP